MNSDKERVPYRKVLNIQEYPKAGFKDYSQSVVHIGDPKEISTEKKNMIEKELQAFIPWRKGPFSIFGIKIDSEWQSQLKWDRVLPYLDDLSKKVLCDVGCNNGYYMYRMAHYKPKLVIGIDPAFKFKLQFEYLQKFSQEENLKFEPIGFQKLNLFAKVFDIIFCMGILYHHKNPIGVLENCWEALKPKGQIVIESLGIPGHEPVSFFPQRRYANIRGVWFIPTETCLSYWLKRSRYSQIECHYKRTDERGRAEIYELVSFPKF